MGHGIEKAPDVRVKHPVHLLPENAGVESVQRIVLAAPRPKSVGEPEEVFLVDCFENRRDRLLDDFVLQACLDIDLGAEQCPDSEGVKTHLPLQKLAKVKLR